MAQANQSVDLAPHGWSLAAKGKWHELPPDIRAEISKREADIHRGMTRMDEERNFARTMYQAVQPYEAMFRADGASAPQAVSNVLNVAYVLRTGDPVTKAQTLANVARQFNVDLNLLQPSQQGSNDPTITALQQTVGELRQQLQQQSQFQSRAQQEAEGRRSQEVQQSIQTFAQETDASGQLKHPHFNAVEPVMAAYVQSGITRDLEEAYQMAIYARPDIRAQLQADENAKHAAEAEKQRKAEEARRKGSSIRGGVGGYVAPAPNPNASVREDLEAAFAEARGRI